MTVLLVDGTVLQYLYLAERKQFNEPWIDRTINRISNDYSKIYYEDRSGQSNFQAQLHSSDRIGKKLFGLDEGVKPQVEAHERLLIPNCGKLDSSSPTSALERCAHIPLDHRTFLRWLSPWWRGLHESGSPSFSIIRETAKYAPSCRSIKDAIQEYEQLKPAFTG